MYDAIEVGGKLRKLRGNSSIESVAKAIDISPSALSMYENGERTPRDDVKIMLAHFFDTTVGALFFNE